MVLVGCTLLATKMLFWMESPQSPQGTPGSATPGVCSAAEGRTGEAQDLQPLMATPSLGSTLFPHVKVSVSLRWLVALLGSSQAASRPNTQAPSRFPWRREAPAGTIRLPPRPTLQL